MCFFIDEDNPEDQAYNVTITNPVNRFVNMAATVQFQVTGSGTKNNCILKMPSGQEIDENSASNAITTVKFHEGITPCRVSIGPISDDMLGTYQISGKYRTNNGIFNEIRSPFNILKEGIQKSTVLSLRLKLFTYEIKNCSIWV